MVIREKPSYQNLKNLYKVINKLIKNESCYYTKDELKEKKEIKKEGK